MAAERNIELVQDRTLVDSAHRGKREAFDELYRRHAAACWRLALAVTRDAGAAQTAVAQAFATTLAGEPTSGANAEVHRSLLAATRHAAVDAAPATPAARRAGTGPDLVPASAARQAFDGLPERWRSILWLTDVDGLPLGDAAHVLEVSPTATAPLAARARLGLREQVLRAGLDPDASIECRRTTERLTDYAAGRLTGRDEARVRRHLDGCADCRAGLAVLDDVVAVLRTSALPLPAALADDAAHRWSSSLVRSRGPLHLVLPGGQPMPVWGQRAVAGAAAAVIALGIMGATILAGGRGRTRPELTRPATADTPLGAADGESALGALGLGDLVLDGTGFVSPSLSQGAGASTIVAARDGARSVGGLPRTTSAAGSDVTSTGSTAPVPAGGSSSPQPGPTTTTPTPPPPAPPAPEPAAQVTVGVDGVAEVTVGDQCTGVQALGTTVGCEPAETESDAPVTLDAGGTLLAAVPLGL